MSEQSTNTPQTLRNMWELAGLRNATEVAAKAQVSLPVVYKMLHKEKVQRQNMLAVCRVLDITEDMYRLLAAE